METGAGAHSRTSLSIVVVSTPPASAAKPFPQKDLVLVRDKFVRLMQQQANPLSVQLAFTGQCGSGMQLIFTVALSLLSLCWAG